MAYSSSLPKQLSSSSCTLAQSKDERDDNPTGKRKNMTSIFRRPTSEAVRQDLILTASETSSDAPEQQEKASHEDAPIIKRASPIFSMLSGVSYDDDEISVASDATEDVELNDDLPFFVIQFNEEGKGQVIRHDFRGLSFDVSNRKRTRSKDFICEANQRKVVAISRFERLAEVMDALVPTMCAAVSKSNLGSLTPYHSSSSILMHQGSRGFPSPKHATTEFYHKSYMATTLSTCRAF